MTVIVNQFRLYLSTKFVKLIFWSECSVKFGKLSDFGNRYIWTVLTVFIDVKVISLSSPLIHFCLTFSREKSFVNELYMLLWFSDVFGTTQHGKIWLLNTSRLNISGLSMMDEVSKSQKALQQRNLKNGLVIDVNVIILPKEAVTMGVTSWLISKRVRVHVMP